MSVETRPMTADDLLRLPRGRGVRYELVRGELKEMSPAGRPHGRYAINLTRSLLRAVDAGNLGRLYAAETGFRLRRDPDTVRAPDLAFVRKEVEEAAPLREGFGEVVPDLVVEVLSPSETYGEVEEKVFDWLEAGVRMVVVVNPRRRSCTVYRSTREATLLSEDDVLDGGDVVPGWRMPVREAFQ